MPMVEPSSDVRDPPAVYAAGAQPPPAVTPLTDARHVGVAVIGAVFVLHVAIVLPLVTALVLLVAVAVTARLRSRTDAPWVHP